MPDIKDLVTNLGSKIILERPPLRPPPNFRRTVMIDFENVASGTAVDTLYSAQSVSFASVTTNPPKRWSAYAMAMNLGAAQSGKNVLTLTNATGLPLFDARYGAVEATFSQLQQSVSVWAYALDSPECLGGNYDNRPFMEAYDTNGTYLGKARTQLGPQDANFFGHWHPISFSSASRNIQRIRLSSQAQGCPWVYTAFDNLTYDRNILLT